MGYERNVTKRTGFSSRPSRSLHRKMMHTPVRAALRPSGAGTRCAATRAHARVRVCRPRVRALPHLALPPCAWQGAQLRSSQEPQYGHQHGCGLAAACKCPRTRFAQRKIFPSRLPRAGDASLPPPLFSPLRFTSRSQSTRLASCTHLRSRTASRALPTRRKYHPHRRWA